MKDNLKKNDAIDIMIVEDSPTQAEKLGYILANNGYVFNTAKDGVEALQEIRRHKPTLIISDILMPEMDGYELCRIIKSDEILKTIPIILLTKLDDIVDIINGLNSGADGFLTKPIDEQKLIERINFILANRMVASDTMSDIGVKVILGNKSYLINAERLQILDLLIDTFEDSLKRKIEFEKAIAKVEELQKQTPICASCKKIREKDNKWIPIEEFLSKIAVMTFLHGMCPECMEEHYPGWNKNVEDR